MKLRFYFDYSDYRSYLMMHALRALDDLPVSVQWIALDAYSLRALSGCASHEQSPNEREFSRREAQRFCMREGIEFVWQSERIHHGTALRAGIWLMVHDTVHFEPFSRKVLEIMWGLGKQVDAVMLRQILTELDIDAEKMLGRVSERENFQLQDACLQEALADGIFDVPTVVIGDELVCHFDHADEMRRLALVEWLQSLPPSLLCQTLAREFLQQPREVFRQKLSGLTRKFGLRQTINTQIEGINAIQHTLAIPGSQWHISKRPVREDLKIHVCRHGRDLAEIFASTCEGAVNLCPQMYLAYHPDMHFDVSGMGPRLFYAWVKSEQTVGLLCLRVDAGSRLHTAWIPDRDVMEETLRGWSVMAVSSAASPDLNLARLCAHVGAHCVIRTEEGESPLSEAFGSLATAWILEISHRGVAVIDTEAHRRPLVPGTILHLSGSFRMPDSGVWQSPAPRTLLLCDKALTFGELSAHADIELSSRGTSLLVMTAEQSSELISTRPYERVRVNGELILLMPLNAEQLFVTELISHRLLDAFNQAPRESLPILVSYWSELEFEMLEIIRPVMAAWIKTFRLPIVLVVGTQVVEIWLANAQGQPYRIEKEDDCFSIDMAELLSNADWFAQMLNTLGISEQQYLTRLQAIENASRCAK